MFGGAAAEHHHQIYLENCALVLSHQKGSFSSFTFSPPGENIHKPCL